MAVTLQPRSEHTRSQETEIERGSFARAPARADTSRLVVVTYNLRYGVGSHLIGGSLLRRAGFSWPGRRPRLVASNVARAARLLSEGSVMPRADIVAIQEADRGTIRAGGKHVALELARALEMDFVRAHVETPSDAGPKDRKWWLDFEERMTVGEEGDTGVAILSRLPLSDAVRIELPWSICPWRPRLALAAVVGFGARSLHVFNSHVDTHAAVEGQLEQHRAVLAVAERASENGPTILLGDFNTMTTEACEAARALLESHGYTTPIPTGTATWRSGPLRHHFDWIFTRGLRVPRWGVARARGISDHWPVWAEVEAERL